MLGTALLRSGSDSDGALSAQEEALRIARAQALPEHLLLFFIRRAGEVNSVLGRAEEADELLREALAMSERVNGEKHSVTVATRRGIASNLAGMSRFDEAAEIATRTIADTMSGAGGETYLVRDNHRMLFDVHWGRGDMAAASRGSAAALATFGPSTPVNLEHADLLFQGAAIDSVYGLHEQALAKLSRAAEVARHARIAQTSMFFSNLALREARARIGVGDALRARALLEEQLAALRAGPGVARQRAVLNAVLVHAFIALGDIPQANRAAEQAERELAREPRRANLVNADAQVERAMGQAAMAEGAFDRALPHLERAAALYRSIHVSDSPFRAEAEALRAACLAQLGRRDEAMAALALARVAQAEHGKFGEDFTRVLHQAETLAQAAAAPVARAFSR